MPSSGIPCSCEAKELIREVTGTTSNSTKNGVFLKIDKECNEIKVVKVISNEEKQPLHILASECKSNAPDFGIVNVSFVAKSYQNKPLVIKITDDDCSSIKEKMLVASTFGTVKKICKGSPYFVDVTSVCDFWDAVLDVISKKHSGLQTVEGRKVTKSGSSWKTEE